jgi:hypothetical protein
LIWLREKDRGESGEESSTPSGETVANGFAVVQFLGVVLDAIVSNNTEKEDGYRTFMGINQVTDLQKYGDSFGPGTQIQYDGSGFGLGSSDTFTLGNDGAWRDGQGNELNQDSNGHYYVCFGGCTA